MPPMSILDVSEPGTDLKIRELLTSGAPAAVFCADAVDTRLSESLQAAQSTLIKNVTATMIDCTAMLPSTSLTVLERVGLVAIDGTAPSAFHTTNRGDGLTRFVPFPEQLFPVNASVSPLISALRLLRHVSNANEIDVPIISGSGQANTRLPTQTQTEGKAQVQSVAASSLTQAQSSFNACIARPACVVFLTETPSAPAAADVTSADATPAAEHASVLARAARRYRGVAFVTVDARAMRLDFPQAAVDPALVEDTDVAAVKTRPYVLPALELKATATTGGDAATGASSASVSSQSGPRLLAFRSILRAAPASKSSSAAAAVRSAGSLVTVTPLASAFPATRGDFETLDLFLRSVYGPANLGLLTTLDAARVADTNTMLLLDQPPAATGTEGADLRARAAARRAAGKSNVGEAVALAGPPTLALKTA